MTEHVRFNIAFCIGQLIGLIGLLLGLYLMLEHKVFWYFIASSLTGLVLALTFIKVMYTFVKVKK